MTPVSRARSVLHHLTILAVVAVVTTFVRPAAAQAQAVTAVLTFPLNGAINVDVTQPLQWTPVANVQAYYLYVGTTRGAKDLVDSGEILQTSYPAGNLPAGRIVYARLWTKAGGTWTYSDSTFTAAPSPPLTAVMTYPAAGTLNADMSKPVQWTSVAGVQAYYLYVGTTAGAKDLVNTGEIQQTSYLANGLPVGQIVYARLWTKVAGIWRYSDSTFSAAPIARLTYPANGAVNVDLSVPIQWTSVATVQAYYLYVGTTPGAKDLVNTGEIQQTSYVAGALPAGQVAYARLWTKAGGVWRYSDSTFTPASSAPLTATITYPANGTSNADMSQPFRWTTIANVQAYYLYVGTVSGAKDVVNTGETQQTSYLASNLPSGQTLYIRMWTKVGGVWRFVDSSFSAAPSPDQLRSVFTYPLDGVTGVDKTHLATWTSVPNVQAYYLYVGSTVGAKDLIDSGEILSTSYSMAGLPTGPTLYARLWTKTSGIWRHTDIAFTLAASSPSATIQAPADGESGFDTARAFAWQPVPLARGYRLTIGSTPGASDLHDSGEIHTSRRFVPNLPAGVLYGRLQTKINGQWLASSFSFSVAANTVSLPLQIDAATWAAGQVRDMAEIDNSPLSWTELATVITPRLTADCVDYATALLHVLSDINLQVPARRLDVAFTPGRDAHTLVEIFRADVGRWMVVDPTFGLAVTRAAGGDWASAEDISEATRTAQWGDLSYVIYGSMGDNAARSYYLDYPLLFVNVYHQGQTWTTSPGAPVLPYVQELTLPVAMANRGYVLVACPVNTTTTTLNVDGADRAIGCSAVDGLSFIFAATTIATVDQTAAGTKVYQPRRFVF